MQILVGLIGLLLTWLMVLVISHSLPNTLDYIALVLHNFASDLREAHEKRTIEMQGRWSDSLSGQRLHLIQKESA